MSITCGQAWREAQTRLESAGLHPAPREGKTLVAQVIGAELNALALQEDTPLTPAQCHAYEALLARRLTGEPLAYVLGVQSFWNSDWQVGKGVLIPRPDSEILVQEVLAVVPESVPCRIVEVGLGSGAMLGSILQERALASGVGTDISPVTLQYARKNLEAHGLLTRVQVFETSVLHGVEGGFEVIFSNPPYISAAEYAALEPCVREYEPKLALIGEGDEGAGFYAVLLAQAMPLLVAGGWVVVEIGHTQGEAVAAMFAAAGLQDIAVVNDLVNRPRVVKGRKL